MSDIMLVSGNATPALAQSISEILGVPLAAASIGRFSDGEIAVEVKDNVRGRDVFIIQSTCPPVNDNLMELVVIADALRRASAGRITAVIPYYGYGRQDRRTRSSRVPITARLVADMLTISIDRVLTVDIHAEQIQGFFHIPVDNVYCTSLLYEYLKRQPMENPVVVSPDIGGVVRARAMAKRIECDLAIIDKRRPKANEAQIMHIIGDVKDRHCIIVDDIVDTAGTLCKAAAALIEHGAKKVDAYIIHPVLSGEAIQNIQNSVISSLVVTDTIPLSNHAKKCARIKQISLAPLLAETIRRIHMEESLSIMFSESDHAG
ncbi:MAG: ribose-phosphate pyrophosphokinase [Gammaproteobacteria bacterium]|nr:ribose-phosphate pyrophosphokinase [Gammaproteobacteria bacterium]